MITPGSASSQCPVRHLRTMRFGSTAKVLLKCKLKYYRISESCASPACLQARPDWEHVQLPSCHSPCSSSAGWQTPLAAAKESDEHQPRPAAPQQPLEIHTHQTARSFVPLSCLGMPTPSSTLHGDEWYQPHHTPIRIVAARDPAAPGQPRSNATHADRRERQGELISDIDSWSSPQDGLQAVSERDMEVGSPSSSSDWSLSGLTDLPRELSPEAPCIRDGMMRTRPGFLGSIMETEPAGFKQPTSADQGATPAPTKERSVQGGEGVGGGGGLHRWPEASWCTASGKSPGDRVCRLRGAIQLWL